jgi:hypothetical protein
MKFLLLLYVAKGSSSLNLREKRTILNQIQPCKVNLTHTLGTSNDDSKATVCLSFRLVDSSTTSDCRTIRTSKVQDVRL